MAPRDIAPHHSSERQQGPWHGGWGLRPRLTPLNIQDGPGQKKKRSKPLSCIALSLDFSVHTHLSDEKHSPTFH